MSLRVRPLRAGEGEALKALRVQLARETPFLLRTADEILAAPAPAAAPADSHRAILVAECEGGLAGFIALNQGTLQRNRHVASCAIGVLRAHWGSGAAGALMEAGEQWCRRRGVERLELGVMECNVRALAFYARHGFAREGVKAGCVRLDDGDCGEVLMARRLA